MNKVIQEFLEKDPAERAHYLRVRTKEERAILFDLLAAEMGYNKSFSLSEFCSLDMAYRVQMTPKILQYEPQFCLQVLKPIQLEIATSGGGRHGRDRKYQTIEPGIHHFSFRKALVLFESYGPDVEFMTHQRDLVREIPKEEARTKSK